MKFAYLILAHRYPSQLTDLVNQLHDGENYFFIHIDQKVDITPFLKGSYISPEHVFFCKNRANVSWAGFSQIEATLNLIHLVKEKDIKPEYVHLISGQDFPIKSNLYIKEFFKYRSEQNFMVFFTLPCEGWSNNKGLDRINYKWFIDETGIHESYEGVKEQMKKNECVPYPKGYIPYGGSQWWSLTNETMDYIVETCKPGSILYEFHKTTFIPDELYFQTVLLNSRFKDSIINNNLRYIDWASGPEFPRTFREDDIDKLKYSNRLYARKFDDNINSEVRLFLKNNNSSHHAFLYYQ